MDRLAALLLICRGETAMGFAWGFATLCGLVCGTGIEKSSCLKSSNHHSAAVAFAVAAKRASAAATPPFVS